MSDIGAGLIAVKWELRTSGFSALDIEALAEIHRREVSGGFLSSLPLSALKLIYAEITENRNCVVVAAFPSVGAKPVGYIAGTLNCAALYRDFLKRKGLKAFCVFLPALLSVPRIRKAFETLLYPTRDGATDFPAAELLNFAVQPPYWGTGLAQDLFLELIRQFRARGADRVRIVTGEGQTRARRFYEKMGARRMGQTSVHAGQNDQVLVFAIR